MTRIDGPFDKCPVGDYDIVRPYFGDGSVGFPRHANRLYWSADDQISEGVRPNPSHRVVAYEYIKRGRPDHGTYPLC